MSKDKQQPRGLQPDIVISPEDKSLMRVGLHTVNQLLGSRKRAKQLRLIPEEASPQDIVIDTSGLDLSLSELRALNAILLLLDKTDYQGNMPAKGITIEGHYQDLGGYVTVPRLSFTFGEYFEAYGLERGKSGRYSMAQRRQAEAALERLHTERRELWYERKRYDKEKGEKVTDAIQWTMSLIPDMFRLYAGLSEEQSRALRDKKGKRPRATGIVILPHYVLLDQLDSFHILLEVGLHTKVFETIAKLRGTKRGRPSTYHYLFILWLSRLNADEWSVQKSTLATALRLGYLVENRRRADIDRALDEAIAVAMELGYLESYQESTSKDGQPMYIFKRNAEKFSRYKKQRGRKRISEPES